MRKAERERQAADDRILELYETALKRNQDVLEHSESEIDAEKASSNYPGKGSK